MHKKKVVVYAICKNEEKFVERWVNSMKEADEIYVLDTGSTDNTVSLLESLNVKVTTKIIVPWRFDVARNESLKLVPHDADICVCTDLDEVFIVGWRKILEENWDNITRVKYTLNSLLDDNDKPLISFYISKIHSRFDYKWINPIHEILKCENENEKIKIIENMFLNHYPDKEKSRGNYLSLLKLAVKEDPENDRNMHYLGREYMYYNENDKAIYVLKKHLMLKSSNWKDERCASMRFIARCYMRKNEYEKAIKWYKNAIHEAPYLRDPYVEFALLLFKIEKYNEVIYRCNQALDIEYNKGSYINEVFSFDHTIYDLLSLCYYYKNDKNLAIYYINKALEISPNIERLLENKKIFLNKKEI